LVSLILFIQRNPLDAQYDSQIFLTPLAFYITHYLTGSRRSTMADSSDDERLYQKEGKKKKKRKVIDDDSDDEEEQAPRLKDPPEYIMVSLAFTR
jgi:hypothetical protein